MSDDNTKGSAGDHPPQRQRADKKVIGEPTPIFVRRCCKCGVLVQTHDQTGETPCDVCAGKA